MLMFNFTTTSSMLLMKQTQHDSLVVVFIGNMELGVLENGLLYELVGRLGVKKQKKKWKTCSK